jgi:hypothetical protein
MTQGNQPPPGWDPRYPPPGPGQWGQPPPQVVVVKQGGATDAWHKLMFVILAIVVGVPVLCVAGCVVCTGAVCVSSPSGPPSSPFPPKTHRRAPGEK